MVAADVYSPVGNPPPSYKPNGYPVTVSQPSSQEVPITVDLNSPPVVVSDPIDVRDIELVEQTFARVAMLQPENVGKVIFMKFFKIQPAALELFSFKGGGVDAATLFKLGSPASKHATMVVKTVAIAISLLRDLGTLVPVLQAVGTKHYELSKCKCNAEQYGFGLIPDHYGDFGAAVIEALTVALGPNFTEPVQNAWVKIYTTIVNVWIGSAESGGTIQVADYINYSGYTVRLDAPPVDVSAPIDERDIQLVEQSFAKVACLGADTVGKVIFTKFLAKQPSAAQNFPFNFADWGVDRKATAHVTMVVKTVAVAVSLLRDLGTLVPVLQAIGTRHHELANCKKDADQHGFGLIPDHYGDFGGAVIESLAIALGPDFTEPVKNAWLKIYTTIVSVWTATAQSGPTIQLNNYWNHAYTVDLASPAVDVSSAIEDRDIQLVEQTFAKVACLGADTVGKVIFTKFLAKQPTALQNFSFKDEPVDWAADRKATAHVTMVVKTVAIAVSLLRDLNTLVPVLQAIGTRHFELEKCKANGEQYGFGLIPEHYGDFGGAVIESLAIALGPDFTEPAKNAWLKVYTTIVSVWNGAAKTGGTIRCDNYMNPTYTVDLQSPAVDVAAALDKRDIDLVQQSFAQAASLGADTVGKVVFMQIFKAAPGAIDLFSFKADGIEYAKLFRLNSPATKHATKVVTTVATAVSLLTDLDTLVPVLQGLGLKHGTLGIVAAHYDVVGEALIASLQIALGANFTEPVKNSWLKVYGTIKKVMTEAAANPPKADTSKADTSKKAK